MSDWREAKREAEEEEASHEVAAWLVVLIALPFVLWAYFQ